MSGVGTGIDEGGELYADLRRLCRGRGIVAPDATARVGAALAWASTGGTPPVPRAQLVAWLNARLAELPDDLRLVGQVALGLDSRARQRFLGERLRWLADLLARDERTVRRRATEALRLLAEVPTAVPDPGGTGAARALRVPGAAGTPASLLNPPGEVVGAAVGAAGAVAPPGPTSPLVLSGLAPADGAGRDDEGRWYARRIRSLVHLAPGVFEVLEERWLVAVDPGLHTVVAEISLPRRDGDGPGRHDLAGDVLFGGVLRRRERPSTSHFRFVVALPRALRVAEDHLLGLRFSVPPGQPVAPHYAYSPIRRVDELVIRVRFEPGYPPGGVWLLDGVPPRTADDEPTGLPPVRLDAAGEAVARFVSVRPGLSYGFRWR
jgi:hypothetical protein